MSDSLFSAAGFDVPGGGAPAQSSTPDVGTLFKAAGFALPSDKPAPKASGQFRDEIPIPVPGTPEYDKAKVNDPATADTLENHIASLTVAIDPLKVIPAAAASWWDATKKNALAGGQQYQTGLGQVRQNLTGTGIGNAGLGALGTALSPLAGAIDAFVKQPVTQATGNPAIGEDVGNLAGFLLPTKGASTAIKTVNENRAIDALVKTIGPENVPGALSRLQSNPRLALMDVSDPVRTVAQGLIDPAQPQAQNILTQAVRSRAATLPAATNSAFTAAMGPTPNVPHMLDALKQRAMNVGTQIIQPAIENAEPIPIKPLLRNLDKQIGSPEAIAGETPRIPLDPTQIKLLNLRQQITNGEMAPLNERVGLSIGPIKDAIESGTLGQSRLADFTEARRLLNSARRGFTSEDELVSGLKDLANNQKIVGPIDEALKMIQKGPVEYRGADFLHGVQSRLREYAQNLSQSSVGSERSMSHDLFAARDNLINAIDKASGGQYKPGLAKYRDAMQIQDAFDSGFDTLKNRSGVAGLEDRPDMFAKSVAENTPEQVVARRLGTRLDIDQKIRGVKNQSLAGQNITAIEYNRDKLASLFGQQEADRLVRTMNDAADEARTNAKMLEGSKTAETLAGREALKVPQVGGGNPLNYLAGPALEAAAEFAVPGSMGIGAGLFAAGKAAQYGVQTAAKRMALARNIEFAKAVSATGQARTKLIGALAAHPDVVRQLQKSSGALTALPSP